MNPIIEIEGRKIGYDYDKDGINTSKGNINKSLLKELNDISSTSKDFLNDLKLNKIFKDNLESSKKIISDAMLNDISTPVLSASLNWYLNLSSSSNPSNLIQAQRDFFGRHKVQLVDSEEDVNIDWD